MYDSEARGARCEARPRSLSSPSSGRSQQYLSLMRRPRRSVGASAPSTWKTAGTDASRAAALTAVKKSAAGFTNTAQTTAAEPEASRDDANATATIAGRAAVRGRHVGGSGVRRD